MFSCARRWLRSPARRPLRRSAATRPRWKRWSRAPSLLLKANTHEVEFPQEVLAPPEPRSAPCPPAEIAAGEAARAVMPRGARIPFGPDDDRAYFRLGLLQRFLALLGRPAHQRVC